MNVDDAIRTRRTTKSFTPVPIADHVVRELLALAVLAPNHHETEPWRFWVVGRETLEQLAHDGLVDRVVHVRLERAALADRVLDIHVMGAPLRLRSPSC